MRLPLTLAIAIATTSQLKAADQDHLIEWDGLSHAQSQDRSPRVPINGEAFAVRFQAFRGDLTNALVHWNDGTAQSTPASVIAQRGPYDIWEATIPSSAASSLS